jgi:hypothetical protein
MHAKPKALNPNRSVIENQMLLNVQECAVQKLRQVHRQLCALTALKAHKVYEIGAFRAVKTR